MSNGYNHYELAKYERETKPYSNAGCPHCGAASASHVGNIWHGGAHVGDAWECDECAVKYCAMRRTDDED